MAFYIKSTDPNRSHYGYSFWSENGEPVDSSQPSDIVDFAKSYSTESAAQTVIDTSGNWVHFQKSMGLTFSVVEI